MKKANSTRLNLNRLSTTFLMLVAMLFCTFQTQAQGLPCIGDVNITLDANCQAIVTADEILTGTGYNYSDYDVTFTDGARAGQAVHLGAGDVGQSYSVTVTGPTGLSCWGNILVEDKTKPTISCDDLILSCTDALPTAPTSAADACGPVTVTFVDTEVDNGCDGLYSNIITRVYTATDGSGNTASCTQTISIERATLAGVVFPANVQLDCQDNTDPANTGSPSGATCFNLDFTYVDQRIDICAGSYKLLREWTVADWCTETIKKETQIIKVLDTTGPALTCPANLTIGTTSNNCLANVSLPVATATDDCSAPIEIVASSADGTLVGNTLTGLSLGDHLVTYTATDACGNESTCSILITVVDNIAPIAICDEHTIVGIGSDGTALVPALTFDDGSSDNCNLVLYEVRRMDNPNCPGNDATVFGETVPFTCCDLGATIMVELRVTDEAGNTNSCMVEVEVQDKLNPIITCPTNKTIECDEDFTDLELTGEATATDNCPGVVVTSFDIENLGCGGVGSVSRIWTATDAQGRTASCIQTITIINSEPFYINRNNDFDPTDDVQWPLDYTTNTCGAGLDPDQLAFPYDRPVLSDDVCDFVAVTYKDTYLPIQAPACVKILRKWIVIDWCQAEDNADPTQEGPGVWHYVQVIKVMNSTDPVFDSVDGPAVVDNFSASCGSTPVTFTAQASDDCTDESDLTYTYAFNTGLSGNGKTATGAFADGSYSVTFTVADGCGNTTTETRDFIVRDAKKPTPVCIFGLASVIMPSSGDVEIWATDFVTGSSYDNCTDQEDLKFSFSSDVNDKNIVISCGDVTVNGLFTVQIWVTDLAGNQDFCTTVIQIQDPNGACAGPTALISGTIENEYQETVEDVTVNIDGGNMAPIVTDANGSFTFPQLSSGGDYSIALEKEMNYLNGVSTYDLVLISKHILGTETLDSPYKIIAADANHSETVTTLDIVKLRALILHIDETLSNNTSWRFVDGTHTFADATNPFATSFPETVDFSNLTTAQQANFVAVKIGDVNGSSSPNNLVGTDTRTTTGTLAFDLEDQKVVAGETFTVDFKANDFNVAGYQFGLGFNNVEFVDVTTNLENLTVANFGLAKLNEGVITTSWNNAQGVKVANGETLFTLTFQATADVQLSEALTLTNRYTVAEAYTAASDLYDVNLNYNGGTVNASAVEVFQNTPNPFKAETTIGFYLPAATHVSLKIYDVAGRVLRTIEGDYSKGTHQVNVNRAELNGTGVLYYQFDTEDYSATKKMILVD